MSSLQEIPNIKIIRDRLIVGQFLQKYLVPGTDATDFTYLLCILDDIELQEDIDWGFMIHYLTMFDIDLLSPSMTQDSKYQFNYMVHNTQYMGPAVSITSALEYFCYFMRPSSYAKYYPHINGEKNPWMWGLDMLLYRHIKLKVCVINHMTMKHWYKNENYQYRLDTNPCDGYNYVMEHYQETTDSLASQPSILYVIFHVGITQDIARQKMIVKEI